ncbi:DUF1549 domain-containing protein [Telmatocola sphagniphila]|uniref:DUF1549 domain-containing protein n=1 Tax=Telmatocola sphagniphila TaxID=1123043 RepID=A0A8E6B824_9BACT|nr:DUF1549 domain-containing protein [Telmatocola sphagniphila]QVL33209.1 DUF1549 domain-containing protein [Telmatocola sphagniphila]
MRLQSYPGAILFLIFLAAQPSLVRADEREDFFESKIRPILIDTCFRCHGGIKTSGGLRLDSREALLKGGDSGPALVIGKPEESLLIRAIRRQADISAMPPEKEKALKSEQIAYFEKWVKEGANWPSKSAKFLAAKHWSFEPVRDWPPPRISNDSLKQNSIDAFLHSRQIKSGLKAAKPADKLILIRRATLDLTGLPPTPAEIDIFLKDTSPGAYASLIERLLKSPAYGERWGRHWLDIVRYADTAGDTADYPVPQAWRYRNYVIDSFNADKPYDQFLREQIAGDILANQGPREKYAEQVIATGYLAISRRFGFDSENYQYLTIQDTIDTLGQSILGLSLGCARCHDHKFDAISMKDYYGLYAIFDSSRYAFPGSEQKQRNSLMVPLEPPAESQLKWREFQRQVAQLSRELSREKQSLPVSIQHSLHEMDGDFEMQAPAAGGSNGVLVPPWLYEGKIAVTNAAQSPFQNLYPSGKAGISISSGAEDYSVKQALYPIYTDSNSSHLYVNLDFRVGNGNLPAKGMHRFRLDSIGSVPVFEILISADALTLKSGASIERLGAIQPNQWYNLQLDLDLKNRKISGRYGFPGSTSEFKEKSISQEWMGRIESVELDSVNQQQKHPAIDYDNIGVQLSPIPAFSEKPPAANNDKKLDRVSIAEQLQAIAGIDGDFESQANDQPPIAPWNAGPNSAVKLSVNSQSPFENLYEKGQLGIHMPNRGEYDGFGQALPKLSPNPQGLLYLGFDFRCESQAAGGNGSWRYYIGHGPGQSAAVELFFNGEKFFRQSGDAREAVGSLVCGQWYQLQLTLDLKLKSYRGSLTSHTGRVTFEGQFATGWDGTLNHTFIDSYGHIGGVRPSLDADNFVIQNKPLPAFDGPPPRQIRWRGIAVLRLWNYALSYCGWKQTKGFLARSSSKAPLR